MYACKPPQEREGRARDIAHQTSRPMTVTTEETLETVSHDVTQCYRVDGELIEFLPVDDVPGYRYRIALNGTKTSEWVPDDRRPSKKLAVFFYEKIENDRYVYA